MLMDFMEKGGVILWVIAFISIIGVFMFFERFAYLLYIKKKLMRIKDTLKKLAKQRRINQIRVMCRDSKDPFSRVIMQIVNMLKEGKDVNSDTLSFLIYSEVSKVEKNFTLLRTFITISPLLGLLGTVTGMIKIFNAIEPAKMQGEVLYKAQLASGISEALYTTVGGLIVAILLSILLSFLYEMRSKYESIMMEEIHDIFHQMKGVNIKEALR